ncbi:Peptide methionine sulfoxide reductase MsrA [Thioalkalivibrio nitratireducens DSM 14787]|uniref:Peptide methionine sulfoxide reductase MsrA n=1 Tax=Thioalkalivibrio nitratireducens (strain DSM 14787 / UNIQEM 213 / ALEN2) TaxID=1255043 RepID=L0DVH7_THIND|nr:Peptide methionine sulfoxide reductase MsrA [Thioalkalivibrio nitratireducens DSM 14787]
MLAGLLLLALPGANATGFSADAAAPDGVGVATFAGGCFWCMEPPFDALEGVISTASGYTGGHLEDPSCEQVVTGRTGHYEVVQVVYDPAVVSYERLLHVYWRNIDLLDAGGQFCDRGEPYRTAVLHHDDEQRRLAEAALQRKTERFETGIATRILPAATFYEAEGYHQDHYRKNPIRYRYYRFTCGRDARLRELWGDEAGGCGSRRHPERWQWATDARGYAPKRLGVPLIFRDVRVLPWLSFVVTAG